MAINQKNDTSELEGAKFIYDEKNNISKDVLNKYVINGQSFKIKVVSTKDNKTIIVNDYVLNDMKEKNININKITLEEYYSLKYNKDYDYVLLKELLKDAKGRVMTFIEILDKSYKHQKEKEIMDTVKLVGANVIVTSQIESVIKYFKKKAPLIVRGISFPSLDDTNLNWFKKNRILNVNFSKACKPDFIEYAINDLPNKNMLKLKNENIMIISKFIDTDAKICKAKVYSKAMVISKSLISESENKYN